MPSPTWRRLPRKPGTGTGDGGGPTLVRTDADFAAFLGSTNLGSTGTTIATRISQAQSIEALVGKDMRTLIDFLPNRTWGLNGYSGNAQQAGRCKEFRTARPGQRFEFVVEPTLTVAYDENTTKGIWSSATAYTTGSVVLEPQPDANNPTKPLLYKAVKAVSAGTALTDTTAWQNLGAITADVNLPYFGGTIDQSAAGLRDDNWAALFQTLRDAGLLDLEDGRCITDITFAHEMYGDWKYRYQLGYNFGFGNPTGPTAADGGASLIVEAARRFKAVGRAQGWQGRLFMNAGPTSGTTGRRDPRKMWDETVWEGVSFDLYPSGVKDPFTYFGLAPDSFAQIAASQQAFYEQFALTTGSYQYWLDLMRTVSKPGARKYARIRETGLWYRPDRSTTGDDPQFFRELRSKVLDDYADLTDMFAIFNVTDSNSPFQTIRNYTADAASKVLTFDQAHNLAANGNQGWFPYRDAVSGGIEIGRVYKVNVLSATTAQLLGADGVTVINVADGAGKMWIGPMPGALHHLEDTASIPSVFPTAVAKLPAIFSSWPAKARVAGDVSPVTGGGGTTTPDLVDANVEDTV